jgi:hypothetical protein
MNRNLVAVLILCLSFFGQLAVAGLIDADRGEYTLLPLAAAPVAQGMGGVLPPNQLQAKVYIKCANRPATQPKPVASCSAPVTLFCEYQDTDCSYTTSHGIKIYDSNGQPIVHTTSHIQCDSVNGACPSPAQCATNRLSKRTRLALSIQSIDQTATKNEGKVQ